MTVGSLHFFFETHRDHEPTAARVGARASWTAATESSESPLWVVRRVDGGLRDLTKLQIPRSKSQRSSKHQAPKRPPPEAGQGFGRGRQSELPGTPLGFETWSLFGAWSLELYQPTYSKSVASAKAVTSRTPSPQSKPGGRFDGSWKELEASGSSHVLRLVLRTQPRSCPSSFSRTQLRLFLAPHASAG